MHSVEFKDFTIITRSFTDNLKFTLERPRIEEDDEGYKIVKCCISTDLGEYEFREFIDDGIVSNELMDPSEYEDIAELFPVEPNEDEPKAILIAQILAEVIGYVISEDFEFLDDLTEIQL